jgi:hypothetical protein
VRQAIAIRHSEHRLSAAPVSGKSRSDNEPVRARDVVASLKRWASRDAFGRFALVDSCGVVGYAGDRAGRDAVRLAAQLATAGSQVTIVFPTTRCSPRSRAREAGSAFGRCGRSWPASRTCRHPPTAGLRRRGPSMGCAFPEATTGGPDRVQRGPRGTGRHLHVSLMGTWCRGACAVAVAPTAAPSGPLRGFPCQGQAPTPTGRALSIWPQEPKRSPAGIWR